MLFSSITFLCFFLPIVIGGYFLVPKKFKNFFLLAASITFYIWGEKGYVLLMLATVAINYGCSLLIEKGYRKQGLLIAIICSLGSLFYFKYFTFAYTNIIELLNYLGIDSSYHKIPKVVLPLGISFYTFQVLSYTIDVYRGTVHANKSFFNFATYVSLFPHLIAGPIVRYAHIEQNLREKDLSIKRTAEGIERFILGLVKKIFLANVCAEVADTVFNSDASTVSPEAIWIGVLAYTFQIYFDFSAYSDMAIGLAKIFGFDFQENFNYPYISKSIKDFWRRWHMSLSTWFRDYLYIPLGGSRGSKYRTYMNLFIVFLATGVWHGASWNFVFWGLWHGMFIVIERIGFDKILDRLWKPLQHIYMLLVVVIGWLFFRADNIGDGFGLLKRMLFIDTDMSNVVYHASYFFSVKYMTIGLFAILFCMPIFPAIRSKIGIMATKNTIAIIPYYIFLFVMLALSLIMISAGTYNPFIYFRF